MQKRRDEPSGLYVSDRFFQPERAPKPHRLLWLGADTLLLACLVSGLLLLFVSGFSVPVSLWFFPAVLLLCAGVTLLFHSPWCQRHWLAAGTAILLLYLLLLFLCQNVFFRGMRQFGNLLADTLNRSYNGGQSPAAAAGSGEAAAYFLLLVSFPAMLWLALSLFRKNSLLMSGMLLFPLLALAALCGAAKNTVALFLILLGILLSVAFLKPKRQNRMWGGENRQLKEENELRFQSIQKKSTAIMLCAFVFLAVPGFFLVRPLLSVSLKPARQISLEVQSSVLTQVMKLLPELSAGQWNLRVEAVGGGVQDGALDSNEGYLLENVEDLRLTLNTKPKETLFLKGYIGTIYENGKWENNYGSTFDGAAINWNTEGDARLYIQNLPFLRTAFALSQGQAENPDAAPAMAAFPIEPAELLVERMNANDSYSYLPYGAYLNDYYQVHSGDGAVAGQFAQEDRFYFFFRQDMEAVLSAWNALEGTGNVLDRVEESYRAFSDTSNRTRCPGMEALRETVDTVIAENRWTAGENTEEISSWIRQYLAENYQYQRNPSPVPEGNDALSYFLQESKTGNSVHFASAAVVLYRLFGVPARYVVGYVVPAPLFSAQPNGSYTATVQGDNAQAWAEIYVPGIGWMPKDMTPGVIGTLAEVGPGGEKIEAAVSGGSQAEEENLTPEESKQEAGDGEPDVPGSGRLPIKAYTVEQIVTVLLFLALTLLIVTGCWLTGRRLCRAFGFDPFRRYTQRQRLIFAFQALYRRMRRLGLPQGADSQSEEFLTFCEAELNRRCPEAGSLLRPAVEKLYRSCYGGKPVSRGDIAAMRRLLLASYKRAV